MIVKTHAPRTSVGTITVLPKKGIFILNHPISLFSISLPSNSHILPWKLLSLRMSYWHAGYRNTLHISLYMSPCQDFQFHKQSLLAASHQPSRPEQESRTSG